MKYTIEDIRKYLGHNCQIIGDVTKFVFDKAKPINEADDTTLVWVNPNRKDRLDLMRQTKARIIICSQKEPVDNDPNRVYILTDEPKLVYLRVIEGLFATRIKYMLHPTACIHPEAEIDNNVHIGPLTYVGKASIGEGSVIHGNCNIMDGVIIGKNVVIQPGAVLGSEGFGYAKNQAGQLERFPHIGGVQIEDDVEIGANTCIDRGTLGNTRIRKGAKIDNLVHIAHNVDVGENTAIIANAMIAGSTKIGANTWIAPSACLRDAINIGKDATVGLAALVTKDIPDGELWAGFPARKIR